MLQGHGCSRVDHRDDWLSVQGAAPHLTSHPPSHRGTFYQGYLCTRCGVGAHKECLEVIPPCKMSEYSAVHGGGPCHWCS